MESNSMNVRAAHIEITAFVRVLSNLLRRPVIDETGLSGFYDFKLEWAADPAAGGPATETAGPTIFTAIQEQLGLRLESKRAPVPVFVVDKIQRPSEN
jgi:uncharacterized protein (TIGR03435 family)